MSDKIFVEPDLEFIDNICKLGGDSVKKCYQCATCSVVCPISPEQAPFPRKEMLASSWGLKDKVLKSADIWLCHECGDCSTMCPRDAKPGDVLSAARAAAIEEYAVCPSLSKMANDPKKGLPIFILSGIWFVLLAFLTISLRGTDKLFGLDWSHGVDPTALIHTNFISTWLVDFTFVPLSLFVAFVFFKGLSNFIKDIHENAVAEGKTNASSVGWNDIVSGIIAVLPSILKHSKFNECSENKSRATSHMMVFYGFIACFVTTAIVFVLLYLFHVAGPHSQMMPFKWLANAGGIGIVVGSFLMIKSRMASETQKTSYKDWYLLIIVFVIGASGLLTETFRIMGSGFLTYLTYWIHLVCVFNLFLFLPFSKIAHIIYRTVALGYIHYSGRK